MILNWEFLGDREVKAELGYRSAPSCRTVFSCFVSVLLFFPRDRSLSRLLVGLCGTFSGADGAIFVHHWRWCTVYDRRTAERLVLSNASPGDQRFSRSAEFVCKRELASRARRFPSSFLAPPRMHAGARCSFVTCHCQRLSSIVVCVQKMSV